MALVLAHQLEAMAVILKLFIVELHLFDHLEVKVVVHVLQTLQHFQQLHEQLQAQVVKVQADQQQKNLAQVVVAQVSPLVQLHNRQTQEIMEQKAHRQIAQQQLLHQVSILLEQAALMVMVQAVVVEWLRLLLLETSLEHHILQVWEHL
jgi:hypothetical protein